MAFRGCPQLRPARRVCRPRRRAGEPGTGGRSWYALPDATIPITAGRSAIAAPGGRSDRRAGFRWVVICAGDPSGASARRHGPRGVIVRGWCCGGVCGGGLGVGVVVPAGSGEAGGWRFTAGWRAGRAAVRRGGAGLTHRPSWNHRRRVRREGPRWGPPRLRSVRSRITAVGGSPAAHRASASCRSAGQAYEPGRRRAVFAGRTRRRWAVSAASCRRVDVPAARHTAARLTTKSLPARLRWNATLRCASHSQTDTPWVRWCSARGPCPFPAQIAHIGVLPIHSLL